MKQSLDKIPSVDAIATDIVEGSNSVELTLGELTLEDGSVGGGDGALVVEIVVLGCARVGEVGEEGAGYL